MDSTLIGFLIALAILASSCVTVSPYELEDEEEAREAAMAKVPARVAPQQQGYVRNPQNERHIMTR